VRERRIWLRAGATLRAYNGAVVTSARPPPRFIRVAIGSGPKAENSGDTTTPAFSAPRAATYSAGMRGASKNRRSPRSIPSAVIALAKRLLRRCSSA